MKCPRCLSNRVTGHKIVVGRYVICCTSCGYRVTAPTQSKAETKWIRKDFD